MISSKRDSSVIMFFGSFIIFFSFIIIAFFKGAFDMYQFTDLILGLLTIVVAGSSMWVAIKSNQIASIQADAARKQVEAANESIRASVRPKLWFRIRPANDFWKSPWGPFPSGWKTGVGIYIENIGNGPAIDIKMIVEIKGKDETLQYPITFGRMRAGDIYTIPSDSFPKIKVTKEHSQINIKGLEYCDVNRNQVIEKEAVTFDLDEVYFSGLNLQIYLFNPNADRNHLDGERVVVYGKYAYYMGSWVDLLVNDERVKVEKITLPSNMTYKDWLKEKGLIEVLRQPSLSELGVS